MIMWCQQYDNTIFCNCMFDSNVMEGKRNHQACIYLQNTSSLIDNDYGKEANFRKRLHSLLSQNYKLKEEVERLRSESKKNEQQQRELKQHLKIVLQEMANNDKIIQNARNNQTEYQTLIKHLQDILSQLKHQLQNQKQVISSLMEHNHNLQAENELLIEIKEKYLIDLSKLKVQFSTLKTADQNLLKEYQQISISNSKLLEQIEHLQQQIQTKRNNIDEYQKFVLQKLSNAKNDQQFHQKCKEQLELMHEKYVKYKQKSSIYKRQRDQLRFHLQILSRQIDGNTLRKYYDEA